MTDTMTGTSSAMQPTEVTPTAPRPVAGPWFDRLLAAMRLSLGWVFLWAFLDKAFGLGLATDSEAAWVNGGSPTEGFLSFGTKGPFADFYQGFAGAAWADVLFMVGLLAIGAALMLGVGMRIAAVAGSLMLVMMWTAALGPENNPFMDDHLIYALALGLLAIAKAGNTWGFGKLWRSLPFVDQHRWLV